MDLLNSIKNMYKVYELLPSQDSSKQLILEPLSCVLKLSLLQYKPIGTKISVLNNSIQFHEPSMMQGITRSLGGDSRQDLHNICHPLMKCLEWYSISNPMYEYFYKECIIGLTELKSSYESNSIINHTIEHYIGLLQGKDFEPIDDTAVTGGLKDMWTEKEIKIIYSILEHISSLSDGSDKTMYVQTLEDLLISKEKKVYEYIYEISTSY